MRRRARACRGAQGPGGTRAFTLLEILLALALIALLTTVFVGASAGMLRDRSSTPDELFWKACQAARKSAVNNGNPVQLIYDDKKKAFIADDGIQPRTFPLPGPTRDLMVSLLASGGERSAVLLGGVAVETGSPPTVLFFSDGTCTPFRVQFVESGTAHILTIDPWTCAEVLTPQSK